jgi:hypothetical protein
LLFLDHGSKQVTGEVTENTIGASPTPNIVENLTNTNGNITGTVTTTSSRSFRLAGFVRTSHGIQQTEVQQNIQFSNKQNFTITNSEFLQDISQQTNISSVTTSLGGQGLGIAITAQTLNWPLQLDFSEVLNADGSISQTTTIQQSYQAGQLGPGGDAPLFSFVSNSVSPSDTLLFNSSGQFTGNQNQSNKQEYFSTDSSGDCFSRTITAANGLLTKVINGVGCGH